MARNNRRKASQFVAVASIATELSEVMVVAKEISLAAANAKAIAFRAGEKARGFQPITDYINDLARETVGLVSVINDRAAVLYQTTVGEYRCERAQTQINRVMEQAADAEFIGSLKPVSEKIDLSLTDEQRVFKEQVGSLLDQLAEIMYPARAARVIAANSRIEASQAGEFLQSLQAVAESVEQAAELMYQNVQRCRSALSSII